MADLGVTYQPPHFDIVLPVGISFYTFATMSYTLDVYLKRAAPRERTTAALRACVDDARFVQQGRTSG